MTYTREDFFKAYQNCDVLQCKLIGKILLTQIINSYRLNKTIVKHVLNLIGDLEDLTPSTDKDKITQVLSKIYATIYSYGL